MQDFEATTLALLKQGENEAAVRTWSDGRKQSLCRDWCGCADCLEARLRYLSLYDPSGKIDTLAESLKTWMREDGCLAGASND